MLCQTILFEQFQPNPGSINLDYAQVNDYMVLKTSCGKPQFSISLLKIIEYPTHNIRQF